MAKVLIVEDNEELLDNVREWLASEQHVVDCCSDGVSALAYLNTYEYDVIVLDWTLPKFSGLDICKQYRGQGGTTPILMLTGRRTIDDKELGLDAGADDYLTKPFEMRELSARLRALLRRTAKVTGNVLKVANVELDKDTHRVTRGGQDVKLMPKEFAILELLMTYPGKVFSAEALIERIWASDSDASPEIVRKYINRLRNQIDTEGSTSLIRTVHGVGYALEVKAS
jgi:DNA-binding response OmpR family regulator